MKAKEMFEKLGYHLRLSDSSTLMYSDNCDSCYEEIIFYLNNKTYSSIFFDEEEIDNRYITIEEHKAITQQLKELGWLDD